MDKTLDQNRICNCTNDNKRLKNEKEKKIQEFSVVETSTLRATIIQQNNKFVFSVFFSLKDLFSFFLQKISLDNEKTNFVYK